MAAPPPTAPPPVAPLPTHVQNIFNTKTLQRAAKNENIDEVLWQKFMIDLDYKLSSYYNDIENEILLISSPYSIEDINEASLTALKSFDSEPVLPSIFMYLFGDNNAN